MNRRLGLIPDLQEHVDEDLRLRPLTAMKVGGAELPVSVSLRQYVDRVRDQKQSSSCVGQSVARAIHIRTQMLGSKHPFPSALAIYTGARSRELPLRGPGDASRLGLTDDGCRPRFAMEAVTDAELSCLVPEDEWPLDMSLVNERLPLDIFQTGNSLFVRWHRIGGSGRARTRLVKESLAAGYPVVFGMQLDAFYENFDGGVYEPIAESIGNHMQCIDSYNRELFGVVNSWGDRWNRGGYVNIHADVLGSERCFDLYSIETGLP